MQDGNTNVFAYNIIDKYENRPVDLHSLWLADFTSNYVSKKSGDIPVEPEEIKT